MIETIGIVVVGTLSLGYAGFKSRAAAKSKKEKELLEERNSRLSQDVFDSINDKVTPAHIRQFLRKHKKDGHSWKVQSIAPYEWSNWFLKGRKRGRDNLVHEQCKYCGVIRRRWEKGIGTVDKGKMEGYWFGDNKLGPDDTRLVHCPKLQETNEDNE